MGRGVGSGEGSGGTPAMKLRTPEEAREKVLERFLSHKRHSTAVGLMWAIFTCGFVVINVIVFIQPQWIHRYERGSSSRFSPGYIGLYERCELRDRGFDLHCEGKFYNFATISHPALRAATFFVGVSCLLIWICIGLFLLFLLVKPSIMFRICGSLQVLSAVFMSLGCLIFPAGWNDPDVAAICGTDSDQYVLADCQVGWAYILAMVGTFDIIFLSMLAFVLAGRQVELADTPLQLRNLSTLSKNGTFSRNKNDNQTLDDDISVTRPPMYITPDVKSHPQQSADNNHEQEDGLSHASLSTRKSFRSDFAL